MNTIQHIKVFLLLPVLLLIGGCASTPLFDSEGVDKNLTPNRVVKQGDSALDQRVIWGGTILDLQNLESFTQIELLSYPLSSSNRPLSEQPSSGRFIVKQPGFLEPNSYAQGRWMTVQGQVIGFDDGQVGSSSYRYPLIEAEKLKLWSRPAETSRSNVHFGIGIRIHN